MKKLTGIYCNKVLPTVYDDALSYYEVLCKVVYAINEVIDEVNNIDPPDITDEAWNALVNKVNTIAQVLEALGRKVDDIEESLPSPSVSDSGAFMRVNSAGAYALEKLTDVAKEGA